MVVGLYSSIGARFDVDPTSELRRSVYRFAFSSLFIVRIEYSDVWKFEESVRAITLTSFARRLKSH
jgi:hypothetical protein